MGVKRLLYKWIPPIAYDIWKRTHLKDHLYYFNDYNTWEEAQTDSKKHGGNYEDKRIVDRVNYAIQKVRNGEAVYEQDGVCYYEEDNNWELLSALFYVKTMLNKMTVIDFGGALGSTWFRYRSLITDIDAEWCIVEQRSFVDKGRDTIPELDFYYSVDDVFATGKNPNVLLLSSVLMYLGEPYTMLQHFFDLGFQYVIVDETAFLTDDNAKDRIVLQHVPKKYYEAVYPSYLFGLKHFKEFVSKHGYRVEWEWIYSGGQIQIKTKKGLKNTIDKGFLLKRI